MVLNNANARTCKILGNLNTIYESKSMLRVSPSRPILPLGVSSENESLPQTIYKNMLVIH